MLLHVGFHKTGTTWLQRRFFVADAGFAQPWPFMATIDRIVRPHAWDWDDDEARRFVETGRRGAAARGLVPVLSNEELGGSPHAGGRTSAEVADRLATLAPDALVLVVVRRQAELLLSIWKQYVRRGGVLPIARYLDPPRDWFRMPGFRAEHLEYHRLVERYQTLFGRDRVLVLAYESFRDDRDAFLGAIARFAGGRLPSDLPAARERRSLSAASAALQRRLNRWFMRDDVNPTAPWRIDALGAALERLDRGVAALAGARFERRARRCAEAFARGRYAESNRRTQALTGLALAPLGYET